MNTIKISGEIVSKIYSHEYYGEHFYSYLMETKRESNRVDTIMILITDNVCNNINIGDYITVIGEIRSHNYSDGNVMRLCLFVFAKEVSKYDYFINEAKLSGYICKIKPKRKTPNGKLIIDFVVAINRFYGKSDYIPCIAWGSNTSVIEYMNPGDEIEIDGRFQSRDYTKDDKIKTAYEFSVNEIKVPCITA